MEIVALKLVSAEEIIGVLEEETPEAYILKKVRSLIMQQAPDGGIGLGMLPYMPSANNIKDATESAVIIYKEFIMSKPVTVAKTLEDSYIKETTEIVLN